MKKLICLIAVIACCLALGACTIPEIPGLTQKNETCTVHVDTNGDLLCDRCQAAVECTKHVDKDKDLFCDKCDEAVKCNHVDYNNDGVCDNDACKFQICEHRFSDTYTTSKTKHYKKVICGCNINNAEEGEHVDEDNNGECDVCEYTLCAHTYDTEWSYDGTAHWHANTCSCTIEVKDKANHADNDKDKNGICDVCEQAYCSHTYEDAWSFDADEHYKNATCGCNVELRGSHEDCDADNNGICDECNYQFCNHTFNEFWSSNADEHYKTATCGHNVTAENAAHIDEDENGECDVCEYIVCTGEHEIDYDIWNYDETTHSRPSKCGHVTPNCTMEAAGHTWDANYKCTTCDYQHVHSYATNYNYDNVYHWNDTTCNPLIHNTLTNEKVAHVDEDNNGVCDTCFYQFCNHAFSADWTSDGQSHWHERVCDHVLAEGEEAISDKASHVDDPANLETYDGLCDVCAYVTCAHSYDEKYSIDDEGHWYAVACEHKHLTVEKSKHVDDPANLETFDGLCDACGYVMCAHTYATVFSSDAEGHWYAITCEHTNLSVTKLDHVDSDEKFDGICDDCGYVTCAHTYAEEWSFDVDGHWHAITCDHKNLPVTKLDHVDKEGNDGLCEECKYQFCNHPVADTLTGDAEGHWYAPTCTHNVEITKADHVDTKDNNGICDECNYQFCDHPVADTLTGDAEGHWYAPTCTHNVVITKADHVDTKDNNGICDACNYQFCNHTYAEVYSFDKDYHWYAPTCGHDVEPFGKEAHTDETGDGTCEVCKNQFCSHDPADTYKFDGKYHWQEAACGHDVPVYNKAVHVDNDEDGFCDDCERSMTCEHTFNEENLLHDATHHWYAPNCGHDINDIPEYKVPHADTDDDLACDICGGYYEDPNNNDGSIDEDNAIETTPHVITPKA